ncbi:uncharacterized protein LOC107632778 [Arachis ipaensis]|uniref:uncharacterized protein LOC107632778 n=1 Tax=Arachis ipaensis TaxID=130454 RepID=UPI0007AF10FC|nr:uncharacterized protein LOC107632778 [Arachis ipaensis]
MTSSARKLTIDHVVDRTGSILNRVDFDWFDRFISLNDQNIKPDRYKIRFAESIHYDGEIVYDEESSIVFRSGQSIITYMTPEVNSLTALKNLILHSVGQQEQKGYRLRDDEDVRLIRSWHNRWTNVHLLELFVFLVELGGRGSSADTVDDNPLSGAVRRTIRRTMVDLHMPLEGSQEGSNVEVRNVDLMDGDVESHDGSAIRDPMMDQYEVNPDDGDDADKEPPEIPYDGDEEEEMNYYGDTQIALTRPAISRSYDRPDHFTRLNLDAITFDWSFTQGGSEEDPSNEFEVGQQFKNKEEVMLAVKQYSIRRAAEYKIVESDQLRYNAQCIQFGPDCNWSILISYRRKQEKWEVRKYTSPHTCMQTLMGQDHRRLNSKVIAQHIFMMVKADPTISIRVLQGGVENHFGYKASYKKVWLAKQKVIARIYGDWEESYNKLPRWLFAMQMYLPGKIYFIMAIVHVLQGDSHLPAW